MYKYLIIKYLLIIYFLKYLYISKFAIYIYNLILLNKKYILIYFILNNIYFK